MRQDEPMYQVPARHRRMENLHIVFWLVKDISWCMVWKLLGLLMIVPTLSVAMFIAWRTRHLAAELAHNLAVACWISANSLWMISEFFGFDELLVFGLFEGKYLAMIPFSIGAIILLYYYAFQRKRVTVEEQLVTT
ncbi:MAG: hypothetical protein R3E57_12180 [Porticoccaceae bacterium]